MTEAQRLADELDAYHTRACHKQAAAELRRLDAVNVKLLEALKSLAGWFDSDSKESAERHIKKARAAIATTGETK